MAKYSNIKGFTVQTLSSDPVASKYAGGTWTSGGALPQALYENAGAGATQTAALNFGGQGNPPGPAHPVSADTQNYNGSSWTEVNNLNTGRRLLGGAGTYTSAIAIGGYTQPPGTDGTQFKVELWDGTNWTETTDLNTKGRYFQGFGVLNTAAVAAARDNGSTVTNKTETWNGSSWTEVAEQNTNRARYGAAGSSTAGIIMGGDTSPNTSHTEVEQWNGSAWTEIAEINTGRNTGGGSGAYTDALFSGGTPTPNSPLVERYDGTSWTELSDLNTGRYTTGSAGHTAADTAIIFGGYDGSARTTATEEFSAPGIFTKQLEGQLFFNSTANAFKETITDIPGATWSSGGSTNTAREFAGRAGSQTAGLTFGGAGTPSALAITELYNGSSWTEVADLNTARGYLLLGNGTSTSALCSGGDVNPPAGAISVNAINESWDGSSWTEVGDLNTARTLTGQFGASNTSSIVAGGYNNTANVDNNESWNGSSWTEIAEQNTARRSLAAMGIATAGILASGNGPTADVELWDGTSWTETTNVNTARTNLSGSGTQTSSIIYGGRTSGFEDKTEFWNGTSWTELNNLSTGRSALGGSPAGTSSSALAYLGQTPSATTATEEWTADLSNKTITSS